jgi:hypothetical protein
MKGNLTTGQITTDCCAVGMEPGQTKPCGPVIPELIKELSDQTFKILDGLNQEEVFLARLGNIQPYDSSGTDTPDPVTAVQHLQVLVERMRIINARLNYNNDFLNSLI